MMACSAGVALWFFRPAERTETRPGLPHQAYVWQREWRAEVGEAIRAAEGEIESFSLLAGEMQWKNGTPEIRQIHPDWSALRSLKQPPGAVIRIFPSVAGTAWSAPAVEALASLIGKITNEFQANGVPAGEVQLDYDCPESKLADYVRLVRELQQRQPGRVFTITSLPAWLRQADFTTLAREAPGYVLQVHSLHLPQSKGGLVTLCDPAEARAAVQQAAKLRVPFRVALPTYSCVVQFNRGGKVTEVFAEDLPAGFPQSSEPFVVLDADAFQCADLVSDWSQHGPKELQAVVWYRLPVKSDRLNWGWPALAKICRGESLHRGWTAEAVLQPSLHHDIIVRNAGDAPDDLPRVLSLRAEGSDIAASDGLRDYQAESQPDGSVNLRLMHPATHARVPPGATLCIGWCRTAKEKASVAVKVNSP